MSRTTVLLAASVVLFFGPGVRPAPPQIKDITPSGVRRGEPADVVFSGSNLAGNPRLVAPFASRIGAGEGRRRLGVEGQADDRPRGRGRGLPGADPDRRRDLQPVPVRGRPAPAGRREGGEQHVRAGPADPRAAAGRRGAGRGQRRRFLPVPRPERAADRRRRPVRADRLGDRPDDPADDRGGHAPMSPRPTTRRACSPTPG